MSQNNLYEASVRIRSFSGSYFPAFELNTERYSLSLRIQLKYEKIRTKKTPNTDTFHAVSMIASVILGKRFEDLRVLQKHSFPDLLQNRPS